MTIKEVHEWTLPRAVWQAARRALRLSCAELGIKDRPSLRWVRGLRRSGQQFGNYLRSKNLITLDADLSPADAFATVAHECGHAARLDCGQADRYAEALACRMAPADPVAWASRRGLRETRLARMEAETAELAAKDRAAWVRRRQLLELDRETERLRVNALPPDQWRAWVRTHGRLP